MTVDKNLFLYDLAVVSIMKNEAPYAKEWLDYHFLAGVNHFYIFDNESPDNLKEILQPYIDAGIVTYIFYPGKARQYEAYNEAIQKYKFFCRYIAFIDADEFIFPQKNSTVSEVVDEILKDYPNAGGLAVNIYNFGSNFQEKADYSKGVLERFTRRAPVDWVPPLEALGNLPGGTAHVSTITNPRKVDYFASPHFAYYFEGTQAINSNGKVVPIFYNNPPTVDKIVMNHYSIKSKEEYLKKVRRGAADHLDDFYKIEWFNKNDTNEVFDDSILKHRVARYTAGGGIIHPVNYQRCYTALMQNLSPLFTQNIPQDFFNGKMETFLTCLNLIEHLREKVLNEKLGNFLEESTLDAILKTIFIGSNLADMRLLLLELPNILRLKYPVVQDIRSVCINFLPQLIEIYRLNNRWKEFTEMNYVLKLLRTFDDYEHK